MSHSPPADGLSWILSNKGGKNLVYECYQYSKKTLRSAPSGTTYWYCTNAGCTASLLVKGNIQGDIALLEVAKGRKGHTCKGPQAPLNAIRSTLRAEALKMKPHMPMRPVFDEVIATATREVIEQLPPIRTCLNTMRVHRKRADPCPAAPMKRDGWVIPQEYAEATIGNEKWRTLAYDSGQHESDRVICYYNPAVLAELQTNCKEFHLSLDGTFDFCAERWSQQYTCMIKSPNSNKRYPVFFFLLPSKKFEVYQEAFSVLRDFLRRPVASCTLDFEPAAINAVESVFPGCELSLCYFHLCKNLIKHLKYYSILKDEIGFQAYYNLAALPFLHPSMILKGLEASVSQLEPAKAALVKKYFISTYCDDHKVVQ
ncbi:hypothetical protein FOL46_001467 [Perkinsus olseni]|uniref:WRKY domain-containing protein n=1 Tax=Perkinsus olseni TaxID=32597 RepID=A0A7J6KTE3_PEROL|nr:hypothetical protein FOL46_001467 [Perkinsus olseni]